MYSLFFLRTYEVLLIVLVHMLKNVDHKFREQTNSHNPNVSYKTKCVLPAKKGPITAIL